MKEARNANLLCALSRVGEAGSGLAEQRREAFKENRRTLDGGRVEVD